MMEHGKISSDGTRGVDPSRSTFIDLSSDEDEDGINERKSQLQPIKVASSDVRVNKIKAERVDCDGGTSLVQTPVTNIAKPAPKRTAQEYHAEEGFTPAKRPKLEGPPAIAPDADAYLRLDIEDEVPKDFLEPLSPNRSDGLPSEKGLQTPNPPSEAERADGDESLREKEPLPQRQVAGHHSSLTLTESSSLAPTVPNKHLASPVAQPAVDSVLEHYKSNGKQIPAEESVAATPPPNPKRQFWHAGDYDIRPNSAQALQGTMEHTRVHPKFLHSNATSHKWALGAVAELLDNAMDEVGHGATFVSVDMVPSPKDNQPMLVVEDDGGGMSPQRMRACVSLGYSEKSKQGNTIGQYGNGFKTSTMRLGADVIVFSRCKGNPGSNPTQSIGLLSFTFLRETGREDTVVPMIDFELDGGSVVPHPRSRPKDWSDNLATILQWAPFRNLDHLLQQFQSMGVQGTKIIVYSLWLDDEGMLELDFEADPRDIQVRGTRDEKAIRMAEKYPNSHHFLAYRHSLRSYASILYLRRPPGFQIIVRGEPLEHHSLVDDLMYVEEVTYRPKNERSPANPYAPETNMMATVKLGFVKDAKEHIDVQGFNVYHKNRLIKPFWRIWNAAGSQGRGIVGVLEANFVEPAHDKQGFERTQVLQRLEGRLLAMQKNYWKQNAWRVGYSGSGILVPSHAADAAALQAENRNCERVGYVVWGSKGRPKANPAPEAADVKPDIAEAAAHANGRRHPPKPPGANEDRPYHPSVGKTRALASLAMVAQQDAGDTLGGQVVAEEGDRANPGGSICPGGTQLSDDGELMQLVDANWLVRLQEENEELRARCKQLEAAASNSSHQVDGSTEMHMKLRVLQKKVVDDAVELGLLREKLIHEKEETAKKLGEVQETEISLRLEIEELRAVLRKEQAALKEMKDKAERTEGQLKVALQQGVRGERQREML